MANARFTWASILTTVTSTAQTLTTTIEAANKGAAMLNRSVESAAERQDVRLKIENADYVDDLIEASAKNRTEAQAQIEELCKDPRKAQLYQQNYDRLRALVGR